MMTDRERNGWRSAAVGCHWTRGEFHVSTAMCGERSGYTLVRNFERLAEFVSWDEIERLADRRVSSQR